MNKEKKLALIYAKALLKNIEDKQKIAQIKDNFSVFCDLIRKDQNLFHLLKSSILSKKQKNQFIREVFFTNKRLVKFFNLLIKKNRLNLILEINKQIEKVYFYITNTAYAKITSFDMLNSEQKQKLELFLKNKAEKNILTEYNLDKSIINGFKIELDNLLLDNSLSNKLKKLSQKIA